MIGLYTQSEPYANSWTEFLNEVISRGWIYINTLVLSAKQLNAQAHVSMQRSHKLCLTSFMVYAAFLVLEGKLVNLGLDVLCCIVPVSCLLQHRYYSTSGSRQRQQYRS